MVVRRPDDSIRLETPWFDNLITNNGMERVADTIALTPNCYIGRSANTPAITDTQLGSIIATANSVAAPVYTFFDGEEPYWRAYKIFTFNAGNATGDIREVGCGISPTNLFSRALVQGVEEIPITITVLADEKLEVYYERRNYIDITDTISSFLMQMDSVAVLHSARIRASDIDTVPDIFSGFGPTRFNGISFAVYQQKFLGTVYEPISSIGAGANTATAAAYTANSRFIDYTFQFEPNAAVFSGGVGSAMFTTTQSRFQMLFTPFILKTATYRLRFSLRHVWSRYVPAL